MQRLRQLPWGRIACVAGAFLSSYGIESGNVAAALALIGFLVTGAALQAIAVWREKP